MRWNALGPVAVVDSKGGTISAASPECSLPAGKGVEIDAVNPVGIGSVKRDHCGNAAGMVRANVLAASTRRRAAMGKGIEIEAMKPVEIDHVLHAGKMVPRRWDGGSGKSGGGHSKGWSPFLLSEGQALFQM